MSAVIGQGISWSGMYDEVRQMPCYLAAGIVAADVGKALTIDVSGPNKFKLAGTGDRVYGQLAVVEDRAIEGVLVGTINLGVTWTLPIGSGTFVVGDTAIGSATAGKVAPRRNSGDSANEADPNQNRVVEVIGTTYVVVLPA